MFVVRALGSIDKGALKDLIIIMIITMRLFFWYQQSRASRKQTASLEKGQFLRNAWQRRFLWEDAYGDLAIRAT